MGRKIKLQDKVDFIAKNAQHIDAIEFERNFLKNQFEDMYYGLLSPEKAYYQQMFNATGMSVGGKFAMQNQVQQYERDLVKDKLWNEGKDPVIEAFNNWIDAAAGPVPKNHACYTKKAGKKPYWNKTSDAPAPSWTPEPSSSRVRISGEIWMKDEVPMAYRSRRAAQRRPAGRRKSTRRPAGAARRSYSRRSAGSRRPAKRRTRSTSARGRGQTVRIVLEQPSAPVAYGGQTYAPAGGEKRERKASF